MQQVLTFPIQPEGLFLPVLIGLHQEAVQTLVAQGKPVPKTLQARARLDTGTTVTSVSPRLLTALGAIRGTPTYTDTAFGRAEVDTYRIGFSIYDLNLGAGTNLHRSNWLVANLPVELENVEVLFGMDLIRQLIVEIDGPRGTFAIRF